MNGETFDGRKSSVTSRSFYFVVPSASSGKCGTTSPVSTIQNAIQYQNTLIIQSDPLIQRSSDIVKKLTCNWRSSYDKNVSLSPVAISNDTRTVEEIVFTDDSGSRIETWMDLVYGENNPFGETITRPLTVGSKLTLAVYMADATDDFDLRVKDCHAYAVQDETDDTGDVSTRNRLPHETQKKSVTVQLTENGCSLKRELIDNFTKLNATAIHRLREKQLQEARINRRSLHATRIVYSNVILFKFPEKSGLSFTCNIQLCKMKCREMCPRSDTREDRHAVEEEKQVSQKVVNESSVMKGKDETIVVARDADLRDTVNYTAFNNESESGVVSGGGEEVTNVSVIELLPLMENGTLYYSKSVEYSLSGVSGDDGADDNRKTREEAQSMGEGVKSGLKTRSSRQLNVTSTGRSDDEVKLNGGNNNIKDTNVRVEKTVKVIAPNLDDEADVIDALFEKYFTTTTTTSSNNANVFHLIVCFPFPWLLLFLIIFSVSFIFTIYILLTYSLKKYRVYRSTRSALSTIAFTNCKRSLHNDNHYIADSHLF